MFINMGGAGLGQKPGGFRDGAARGHGSGTLSPAPRKWPPSSGVPAWDVGSCGSGAESAARPPNKETCSIFLL